jgi:hypothetical protein
VEGTGHEPAPSDTVPGADVREAKNRTIGFGGARACLGSAVRAAGDPRPRRLYQRSSTAAALRGCRGGVL